MAGVSLLYFVYCSLLFVALKFCCVKKRFIRFFLLLFCLCLYEYLKTKGFVGFSYGVNGYNQWKNVFLIQVADFSGVWGVSFILNYFSVLAFEISLVLLKKEDVKNIKGYISGGIALVLFAYSYGAFKVVNIKKYEEQLDTIKVGALQNNCDPWKSGVENYSRDVYRLMELTDELLEEHPDTEIVLWPETAVVPSILKHYNSNEDQRRHRLICELLEYVDSKSCSFVIGNFNDCVEDDYNSAFVFSPKKNVIPPDPEIYSKKHLVPFTEYFPYKKQFPWLYKLLLDGDTHLWTPGNETKVFSVGKARFSVPICFEDNFGRDCKKFVDNGARLFFNLSNDAWSKSKKCQVQHLQMAVFRSVENHVPSVRSTVSGETCIISSTGKVVKKISSFSEGFVVGTVPLIDS